jgi:hypothetical protein
MKAKKVHVEFDDNCATVYLRRGEDNIMFLKDTITAVVIALLGLAESGEYSELAKSALKMCDVLARNRYEFLADEFHYAVRRNLRV